MDLNEAMSETWRRHGGVFQQSRKDVEAQYSHAVATGIERPVVLLLGSRKDPAGRELVRRYFPGLKVAEGLEEQLRDPGTDIFIRTAIPAADALKVLGPFDQLTPAALGSVPPGHFPLFIAALGLCRWYFLPIPEGDRERPRLIEERTQSLLESRHAHLAITDAFVSQESGAAHVLATVLISLVQRSISHIDGFVEMVRGRNYYCAMALLRLQADNMLRLGAFDLVSDPQEVQSALLDDKPLGKIQSSNGQPLTDAFLRTHLAARFPWLDRVYKQGSGFVHFSGHHIFAPIRAREWTADQGPEVVPFLQYEIRSPGPFWPDTDVLRTLEDFVLATEGLLELGKSWVTRMRTDSVNPPGGSSDPSTD